MALSRQLAHKPTFLDELKSQTSKERSDKREQAVDDLEEQLSRKNKP